MYSLGLCCIRYHLCLSTLALSFLLVFKTKCSSVSSSSTNKHLFLSYRLMSGHLEEPFWVKSEVKADDDSCKNSKWASYLMQHSTQLRCFWEATSLQCTLESDWVEHLSTGCRLQDDYVPQENKGACDAHSWKSNGQAIGPSCHCKPISVELSYMWDWEWFLCPLGDARTQYFVDKYKFLFKTSTTGTRCKRGWKKPFLKIQEIAIWLQKWISSCG